MARPTSDGAGCGIVFGTVLAASCFGAYAGSWLVGFGVFFGLGVVSDAAGKVVTAVRRRDR